jgi:hypothetical protein
MIPYGAVTLYFILGSLIFILLMVFRKDMRKSFLECRIGTRFGIAIIFILMWWITILYLFGKEPKGKFPSQSEKK